MISTHVQDVIVRNAEDLLTRQEVHNLLERLGKDYPILYEEIKGVGVGVIQHILKDLLHEQIPIKDMLSIAEAIADGFPAYKTDMTSLVEYTRSKLKRNITNTFQSEDGALKYFALSPSLEQFLLERLGDAQNVGQRLRLSPNESQNLINAIVESYNKAASLGAVPMIIGGIPIILRKSLAIFIEQYGYNRQIIVLGQTEIDYQSKYEILGSIEITQE